jgi:glutathione S-transferase
MTEKRLLIHTVFLFLLPLIVAWFGVSVAGAAALIVLMLAWRWAISLSGVLAPEKVPDIELETIAASHFVEKVRWCMDRLGIEYSEKQVVGVLGVVFVGRSVPLLKFRSGIVRSRIGNSAEILRYLWGAYSGVLGDKAQFLRPTQERLELEKRLDRYGVDLQVWVYYHILDDRELTLHAWGCNSTAIPAWQRYVVRFIYPVLCAFMRKAFKITDENYAKSVQHIEALVADIDQSLADGRNSILGDDTFNFVDITFASLSALWAQPGGFGNGKADMVHIEPEQIPAAMERDRQRWIENYPHATGFINRLYQQERQA